jgi:release factor glutamine methyltransferase
MSGPGAARLSELLRRAIHLLSAAKGRAPEGVVTSEAEALVQAAFLKAGLSRISRHDLYTRGTETCPEAVALELERMAKERASGRPLQYVTGEQVFLDHVYLVTPDVLIPRPETEALVIEAIRDLALQSREPVLGLEVGLGSGIISIELLSRFQGLQMIATDASEPALAVATKNARAILGPSSRRLQPLLVSDRNLVCEPLVLRLGGGMSPRADFLISNPPYLVGPNEAEEQVSKFEPALALWSPAADPTYFYQAIARESKGILADGAPVFVEIPHERAREIRSVFTAQGWDVTIKPDLSGRERVLIARGNG